MDTSKLTRFDFLRHLSPSQITKLLGKAGISKLKPGETLVASGHDTGEEYFLLAGEVEFMDPAHPSSARKISSASPEATHSLIRIRSDHDSIVATCPASVLKIPRNELRAMLRTVHPNRQTQGHEKTGLVEAPSHAHKLMADVYEDLRHHRLKLPSIPEVARRIQRLIDEGNSANTIARAVMIDPAIAAKLLRAANSPLFRGATELTNCTQAIMRIGLNTTKQLVTTFAMKELFQGRLASTRKQMEELWNHSIEVAAVCYVLAKETKAADPDLAMLAGLLHDIGAVPILTYAEDYPELINAPEELGQVLREFRGETGAIILEHWGFSDEVINAARHAESWQRAHDGKADLADLVIIAQLHLIMTLHGAEPVPTLEAVPAFWRMCPDSLSIEKILSLLKDAHEEVVETRHMLTS